MSYKKNIFVGLIILILCTACGLKESVTQKEPKSFLWFTGNTESATVYIDDLDPIILRNQERTINYEISPGKHTIIIKKSGKEVVNRNVLLGNGITKEIQIP